MSRGLVVLLIFAISIAWLVGVLSLIMYLSNGNDFSWWDLVKGLGLTIVFLLIIKKLFLKGEKLRYG
ncbi:MAG: hypothetical protein V1712_03035 [Patescibacteria group bacterium]